MSIPYINGDVVFQSNKEIEQIGKIISKRLFGGLKFQGKERNIYEEVPAIFIEDDILGLSIILSGYRGYGEDENYVLEIYPMYFNRICGEVESENIDIGNYMEKVLENCFKDDEGFKLLKRC